MDLFEECKIIGSLIDSGDEKKARNKLIQTLSSIQDSEDRGYPEIVNHFIRVLGLYPYIRESGASWQERYISEAFKVDVGGIQEGQNLVTLHREQSRILSELYSGKNIAVSAPTSFGKSFIIDAFIAIKKPKNVMILVPTIALMDETRRRIFKKFSKDYNIITNSEMELEENNIFIFPQERAFSYINKIECIDLLIVDEFYKVSSVHDKERAPSLVKAIIKLSKIAKQRYYLAPNIKQIKESPLISDMDFIEVLDFNTVYLEIKELYKSIGNDETKKSEALLQIIRPRENKALIYAGTYTNIEKISNLVTANVMPIESELSLIFSKWLEKNYDSNWQLINLIKRGFGVHNGRMNRALTQIQIKLFEEELGLDYIISTSSIIEGVNTSAESVIIWKNKIGSRNLKDFTYKNIIGRGGRMFKHFVGKIYLLDAPPPIETTQLEIEFPDEILGDLDENIYPDLLSDEQITKIIEYKKELTEIIGEKEFNRIKKENIFQNSDSNYLLKLAKDMQSNPKNWNGFAYLNSEIPSSWDSILYKVIAEDPGGWEARHSQVVSFVKILAKNWKYSIPKILNELEDDDIDIEKFFQLERKITFKLSSLLSDINELHKIIISSEVDISPFISKISSAFLPKVVWQLEEYGLPRIISKKIQASGLISFTNEEVTLKNIINKFQEVGLDRILSIESMDEFDKFVIEYFYDGITMV